MNDKELFTQLHIFFGIWLSDAALSNAVQQLFSKSTVISRVRGFSSDRWKEERLSEEERKYVHTCSVLKKYFIQK